ncbi:MAG: hypothetical protein GF331_14425 [Chitinivibrionales bacterium]|nr:hypothetical protein [Chitinivibrionales bacterium]
MAAGAESIASVGYRFGMAGRRAPIVSVSLTFALVILFIHDLDRPGAGLITVNQKSMIELYESLSGQNEEN